MAFTSQYYYSHCNLSSESPEFSAPAASDHYNVGLAVWRQEGPYVVDNGVSSAASAMTSSLSAPSIYNSFNNRTLVSDIGISEYDMGSNCDTIGAKLELPEFGEECSGLASTLWSDCYEPSNNNWELMQSKTLTKDPTMKIGKYSVEERKDKILKYLKKRNQRNFNKTIKYACRKTLADKRVRVRGRFARNNNEISSHELGDGDDDNTNNNTPKDDGDIIFRNHDFKIKDDDDDWLHTAMASFMYLPYISG